MDKITYKSIKKIPEVNAYIEQGNRVLGILGYTEHSRGHAVKVAETAGDILEKLGYNEHTVELAQIAGYMCCVPEPCGLGTFSFFLFPFLCSNCNITPIISTVKR